MLRRASSACSIGVVALACGSRQAPATPIDAEPGTTEVPTAVAPEPASDEPAEPGPSEPAAAVLPAAPAYVAGAFEVRQGKGRIVTPTKAFARKRNGSDMQEHAWAVGWTEDGTAFVRCWVGSGERCKACSFTAPDGTLIETLFSGSRCDEPGATKVKASELTTRLAARGVAVRDGAWTHGGDLVVTARRTTGRADATGEPRATLEIGAAPRTGGEPVSVWKADGCAREPDGDHCFMDAHADAVLPSPDGQHIAIVAHMWAGEWSDTFVQSIVPAGRVAAGGYNRVGLDALARGELEAAAAAFVAATHADPVAWKGPYNLACAYARASDARTEAALRLAVERGGDAVRKKAVSDRDLDSVREQPWFSALVEP